MQDLECHPENSQGKWCFCSGQNSGGHGGGAWRAFRPPEVLVKSDEEHKVFPQLP